jgi:hypothetical protein
MKTDLMIPIDVDRLLLVQYNTVAKILGVPVSRYLESYLRILSDELASNPLEWIANELFHNRHASREAAEAAAERFEAYAIEEKLAGNAAASTISASVAEYLPGDWRVKVHHLTRRGWRLIASDLWEEEDDQDESDWWKGQV